MKIKLRWIYFTEKAQKEIFDLVYKEELRSYCIRNNEAFVIGAIPSEVEDLVTELTMARIKEALEGADEIQF